MTERQPTSDPIRVLIADDHPAVRAGLAAVILAEPDLTVAAHAENGEQAVALYGEHRPHLALMDLRMPVLGGVEATRRIVAQFPDARVLALTTYQGDADVRRSATLSPGHAAAPAIRSSTRACASCGLPDGCTTACG